MYKFNYELNWEESEIKSSPSGKFISVLNKSSGYYEILSINNK